MNTKEIEELVDKYLEGKMTHYEFITNIIMEVKRRV